MSLDVQAIMRQGQTIFPVPIKKDTYLQTMQKAAKPGTDQAKSDLEFLRLHTLYERFYAVFNPVGLRGKTMFWEVRFPPRSKWKSGPAAEHPLKAMEENAKLNKYFPGFMAQEQQDPKLFLNADKIADEAMRATRKAQEEEAHEAALRQQAPKP